MRCFNCGSEIGYMQDTCPFCHASINYRSANSFTMNTVAEVFRIITGVACIFTVIALLIVPAPTTIDLCISLLICTSLIIISIGSFSGKKGLAFAGALIFAIILSLVFLTDLVLFFEYVEC